MNGITRLSLRLVIHMHAFIHSFHAQEISETVLLNVHLTSDYLRRSSGTLTHSLTLTLSSGKAYSPEYQFIIHSIPDLQVTSSPFRSRITTYPTESERFITVITSPRMSYAIPCMFFLIVPTDISRCCVHTYILRQVSSSRESYRVRLRAARTVQPCKCVSTLGLAYPSPKMLKCLQYVSARVAMYIDGYA